MSRAVHSPYARRAAANSFRDASVPRRVSSRPISLYEFVYIGGKESPGASRGTNRDPVDAVPARRDGEKKPRDRFFVSNEDRHDRLIVLRSASSSVALQVKGVCRKLIARDETADRRNSMPAMRGWAYLFREIELAISKKHVGPSPSVQPSDSYPH